MSTPPKKKKHGRRGKRLGPSEPELRRQQSAALGKPPPTPSRDPAEDDQGKGGGMLPMRSALRHLGAVVKLGKVVPGELQKSLDFAAKVRDEAKNKPHLRMRATDTSVTICKHINEMAIQVDKAQREAMYETGAGAVPASEVKGDDETGGQVVVEMHFHHRDGKPRG